jgi:hypothetical protein
VSKGVGNGACASGQCGSALPPQQEACFLVGGGDPTPRRCAGQPKRQATWLDSSSGVGRWPRALLATVGEEAVSGEHRDVQAGTPSEKRGRANHMPEGVWGSRRSQWRCLMRDDRRMQCSAVHSRASASSSLPGEGAEGA